MDDIKDYMGMVVTVIVIAVAGSSGVMVVVAVVGNSVMAVAEEAAVAKMHGMMILSWAEVGRVVMLKTRARIHFSHIECDHFWHRDTLCTRDQ